ncbi:DUF6210 family protein [Streptomyces sp. NPDC049541]|uniref:DUF6210 family protein n=1 Tax=Streptomyces sp. NPDC049541 TaxID=3365594 RepID=UPI00378EA392
MTGGRRRVFLDLEGKREGYLLPVPGSGLDEELKDVFAGEPQGAGAQGLIWAPPLPERVRAAAALHVCGSANRDDIHPAPLVLDESRLAEADEAWVPVLTADGPGVLVGENSD